MHRTIAAIMASAGLACAAPALAQAPDNASVYMGGDQLWDVCGKTADGAPPVECSGYVIGVYDAHAAAGLLGGKICVPENLSAGNLTNTVRVYLRDHVKEREYTAASDVIVALMHAYPCS